MKKLNLNSDLGKAGLTQDQIFSLLYKHVVEQQSVIDQLVKSEKRNIALLNKQQTTIRTLKAKLHTLDLEVNRIWSTLRNK